MARIHSFPLFAVRPMYLSVKAFQKALNDVILSRRAIRNMNTLYPNATPEELASVDNVCIICREEMVGNGTAKKLPCNHIFHVSCLRSWFQRQQTCPTCRMNILDQSASNQQQQANNNQQNQNNQQAANQANNNQPNQAQQPQAAQQPNQQPNVPNQLNVNNLRFLFGNLNLVDNFADYLMQDRQQRANQDQRNQRNAADTNGSTTTNQDRNRNARFTHPPTLFPPPPLMGFSFMPFLPFPPPPINPTATANDTNGNQDQTNLSQLSEDELRRLEGNERSALEARIRLLQNLRTSIDAIVLQFQQYNQLIVRSQQPSNDQTTSNNQASSTNTNQASSTSTNNQACSTSTTNQVSSTSNTNHNISENKDENIKASTSKVKTESPNDKPTTSGSELNNIKDEIRDVNKSDADKNDKTENDRIKIKDDKAMNDEELVRQLRLRRFNNQSSDQNETTIKNEESNSM